MFFEKLPFWGQKMIFTPKQKLFQTPLGIIWFRNKKDLEYILVLEGFVGPQN